MRSRLSDVISTCVERLSGADSMYMCSIPICVHVRCGHVVHIVDALIYFNGSPVPNVR